MQISYSIKICENVINEANKPSETFLGFTEKEEIHIPSAAIRYTTRSGKETNKIFTLLGPHATYYYNNIIVWKKKKNEHEEGDLAITQ